MTVTSGPASIGRYWNERYEQIGAEHVSWFQARPSMSLALIDTLGVGPGTPAIDVGGGSSSLVDELIARGFADVAVLDVSRTALHLARGRLADPDAVTWIEADLLSWSPTRRWGLWHDRAVFHFLTAPAERASYLRQLARALAPNGAFVIATFAPDGPAQCSGLSVTRYDADTLTSTITAVFSNATIVATRSETHITPSGTTQPFTWIAGTITPLSAKPRSIECGSQSQSKSDPLATG
jgi:trans-aconitate methyltransferase